MFGKCLKHEFRATARQLCPLFIAMVAVAMLAGIFLGLGDRLPKNEDSVALATLSGFLSGLLIFALIALMIAVAVVAFVMIIRRFYTSFFTDEGYLTFTLPVTPNTHIFTKLFTAYVWQVAATVLCFVCIFIMAFFAVLVGGVSFEDSETVVVETSSFFDQIFGALGVEAGPGFLPAAIALFVVNVVVALAASILMLYLAISAACMLAKKHRVIIGIVCYYVINMVFSGISQTMQSVIVLTSSDVYGSLLISLGISSVICVIEAILCFLGTKWILTRKLNLD